jgi:DNA polymerase-4
VSLSQNGRRYIVHVDIDAFFAAVEVLLDPSLAGQPVIVGGLPHERGVASTCSYEARKFGVHSGMPLRECYRLCPQGVFVRGNYHVYQSFSERFFRVLHAATPDVEEASLDEAYLELTRCGRLYPSFPEAARDLKRKVEREIGVTVSVGAAPNKVLAKLATGRAKPAGFFEIREGEEAAYLRDLGIEALPGIGPKAQVVLRLMNIHKIGQLWDLPRATLHTLFGSGGDDIYLQSRGLDSRPLVSRTLPKSVSRETTVLEDRLYAHVIEVKARTADFKTEIKRRLVLSPLQDTARIYKIAEELFLELFTGTRLALRLVGVKAAELVRVRPLALFEPYSERPERLGRALDQVRDKYGFGSLLTARERMLDAVYASDPRRGYVLKTASLTK